MDVPFHDANGMDYSEVEISKGLDDVTIDEGDNYEYNSEVEGYGYLEGDYFDYEEQEVPVGPKGVHAVHEEEISDQISDSVSEDNEAVGGIKINVAYQFYYWFARLNGFSIRKGQMMRSNNGVILQQTFLCSREGYKEDRGLTVETRTRVQKHETRCGCMAKFRVHIDTHTQRWYVSLLNFDHNHALLEEKYCALLPTHRKMSKADILQIENFRKVGICPPHMYGSFASTTGGYEKVGFVKKNIYNQVGKQRRKISSDAYGALKYLKDISLKDTHMFIQLMKLLG